MKYMTVHELDGIFYLFHNKNYDECEIQQSESGCGCLTLGNPIVAHPPGFSIHGDSLGKNTGVGSHSLLQGISPTKGSNPGLLHCRLILY